MKTETIENRKALFLHQKSREYRGQRRVSDHKTRASRIDRRSARQRLKVAKSLVQAPESPGPARPPS